MPWWLRALTTLAEELCLTPRVHFRWLTTICNKVILYIMTGLEFMAILFRYLSCWHYRQATELSLKLFYPGFSWCKNEGAAKIKSFLWNDLTAWGADAFNLHSLCENIAIDCSSLFSIAVIKVHSQNPSWMRGFVWLTCAHHSLSLREIKSGTQAIQESGAGLKQRPWRNVA